MCFCYLLQQSMPLDLPSSDHGMWSALKISITFRIHIWATRYGAVFCNTLSSGSDQLFLSLNEHQPKPIYRKTEQCERRFNKRCSKSSKFLNLEKPLIFNTAKKMGATSRSCSMRGRFLALTWYVYLIGTLAKKFFQRHLFWAILLARKQPEDKAYLDWRPRLYTGTPGRKRDMIVERREFPDGSLWKPWWSGYIQRLQISRRRRTEASKPNSLQEMDRQRLLLTWSAESSTPKCCLRNLPNKLCPQIC